MSTISLDRYRTMHSQHSSCIDLTRADESNVTLSDDDDHNEGIGTPSVPMDIADIEFVDPDQVDYLVYLYFQGVPLVLLHILKFVRKSVQACRTFSIPSCV